MTTSFRRRRLGFTSLILFLLACSSSGSSGKPSGTYVAKTNEGNLTLVFKGQKVDLTMQETGGQPETKEADYLVNGNEITIQVPGGMPLVVIRDGNTLSGNVMGQIMHFEKK